MPLSPFANRITSVASALAGGAVGGTYVEASLLLSAAISGMAAALWPGISRDRCRFVEAWVSFADSRLNPARISQPLLRQYLLSEGRAQEADAIEKLRPVVQRGRVVTGEEVDLDEAEVKAALPALQLEEIRRHSYPAIFYKQVRSPVVHEYEIGDKATRWPMSQRAQTVSYENQGSTRRIHFHVPWLVGIARSVAQSVDSQYSSLPIADVASWWVEG
jgi:hypothetical protein